MNQQDSTPDTEPAKGSEVDAAAAAKKAAAEKAAADKAEATEQKAAETPKDSKQVTLVHPGTKAKVKVVKPSSDYTNYVRSYGYQEA